MFNIQIIIDQLGRLDFTPYVLAIIVGGVIGLEREVHGRPAGLRTHIMVCLSSAILIQASQILPSLNAGDSSAPSLVFDPNRLGAGVVTGIGFLGAAAVIRSGDIVRGITTGACVWAVAVLGVVIGQGHYGMALAGSAIMLVVLVAFDQLFGWVSPVIYRRLIVRGETDELSLLCETIRTLLAGNGVTIQDLSGRLGAGSDAYELELHVRCRSHQQAPKVLAALVSTVEGISSAEWSQLSL
jgi:putative Mg2+ transporter-C (MgtC) family protein